MQQKNKKRNTRKKKDNEKSKIQKEQHEYDKALKRVFAHTEVVEGLLRGFVPDAWVKDLDFSSLQTVNVLHTTKKLKKRESDVIWKIKFKGESLFIMCFFEFQSSIDPYMPLRILTYLGLVYENLIKQKSQGLINNKKLPPVFPLVFYTGKQPWNAPIQLKDCFTPAIPVGLLKYQPQIEYMLLDVGQIPLHDYKIPANNLILALIELERSSQLIESKVVIDRLAKQLRSARFDMLRHDILLYATRAMKLPERFPGIEFNELQEVSGMLSENLDLWEQNLKQSSRQEGREEILSAVLLKLLEKKHGRISDALKKQLENSPYELMQLWLDKILDEQPIEKLAIEHI